MIPSFAQVINAAVSLNTSHLSMAGAEEPQVIEAVIEAQKEESPDALPLGRRPDIETAHES